MSAGTSNVEHHRRCLTCSYDLHGLPDDRCPECGREFDPADPVTYAGQRGIRGKERACLAAVGVLIVTMPYPAGWALARWTVLLLLNLAGVVTPVFWSVARWHRTRSDDPSGPMQVHGGLRVIAVALAGIGAAVALASWLCLGVDLVPPVMHRYSFFQFFWVPLLANLISLLVSFEAKEEPLFFAGRLAGLPGSFYSVGFLGLAASADV